MLGFLRPIFRPQRSIEFYTMTLPQPSVAGLSTLYDLTPFASSAHTASPFVEFEKRPGFFFKNREKDRTEYGRVLIFRQQRSIEFYTMTTAT